MYICDSFEICRDSGLGHIHLETYLQRSIRNLLDTQQTVQSSSLAKAVTRLHPYLMSQSPGSAIVGLA